MIYALLILLIVIVSWESRSAGNRFDHLDKQQEKILGQLEWIKSSVVGLERGGDTRSSRERIEVRLETADKMDKNLKG